MKADEKAAMDAAIMRSRDAMFEAVKSQIHGEVVDPVSIFHETLWTATREYARAHTLQQVAGLIEGMRRSKDADDPWNNGHQSTLDDILSKLKEIGEGK